MKSKSIVFTVILVIIFYGSTAFAGHKHPEKYYQKIWCDQAGGETEVVMPNKTRCDCLIDTHAIEHDFASKWAEAIGQSLHYSAHTGKRAGIVLIIESEKDIKYWDRLNWTIRQCDLPIDTWAIHGENEIK